MNNRNSQSSIIFKRKFYTPAEVCNMMGMNIKTFYKNIEELPFPVVKICKRYFVPKLEFDKFMNGA